MSDKTLFQYCQKLVILSADKKSILLAKRVGEADHNETYTFIGGKLEVTDNSVVAGMKREKDEEVGSDFHANVIPEKTYNVLFRKKDGNSMILPHIAGIHVSGEVELNAEEYSDYKWVPLTELEAFGPKIDNITMLTNWALEQLSSPDTKLVEI
jgi:8-oxo-dGTP pyrophosphatase MutT (NUDIX family)